MGWPVVAVAQCPPSDLLEPLSSGEVLGDCKTLSGAGMQLASPPDVSARRAGVSQSRQWAYPKTMAGRQSTRCPIVEM